MDRTEPTPRPGRLIALAIAAVIGLAGCSGGGPDGASSAESAAGQAADSAQQGAAERFQPGGGSGGRQPGNVAVERAVIQRAALTVRTDDVGRALAQAESTVAAVGGYVASERTEAHRDGTPRYSTLTVRVPADSFDAVLDELAALGTLEDQSRSAKDVTGEVIDVETRLASAEAAIRRIRLLLNRAQNLGDVIRLESELSERQADLEALEAQHAYYADQTTMATIDLTLLPPHEPVRPGLDDDSGFLAGLNAGWQGLLSVLTGFATVLGAVLPFAALGLLVGIPLWLLVRAVARRRPRPATTDAPPSAG